ncbi:hypothetical protein J2Y69_003364 [Microbacterium resistens]|uniref:Uncharacterized protein n=1 Tax=Microbacterium resistens TaxID=156977 RepID=A0ABU1SGL6_9MICO|nr:hypothetical protein [Microbacterium resistens]MDR6868740.1 hypothetical protein [Microbacterium resistens]
MDYPLILPTAPGAYETEKLGDRAQLRINNQGQGATTVKRHGVEYTHPILNLAAWAAEYGPFRALDSDTDPEPTDPEPLAEWELELLRGDDETETESAETTEEAAA